MNYAAESRAFHLINWIEERPTHSGLTAPEIAAVSGIYSGHYASARAFDDCKKLAAVGRLRREGRPARWFAAAAPIAPEQQP